MDSVLILGVSLRENSTVIIKNSCYTTVRGYMYLLEGRDKCSYSTCICM